MSDILTRFADAAKKSAAAKVAATKAAKPEAPVKKVEAVDKPAPSPAKAKADSAVADLKKQLADYKAMVTARDQQLSKLQKEFESSKSVDKSQAEEIVALNCKITDMTRTMEDSKRQLANALTQLADEREQAKQQVNALQLQQGAIEAEFTKQRETLVLVAQDRAALIAANKAREREELETMLAKSSRTAGQVAQEYLDTFCFPCPREHLETAQRKTSFKLRPVDTGAAGRNPHYLLALYRSVATLYTAVQAIADGNREIDVIYHNNRDKTLMGNLEDFVNKAIPDDQSVKFNYCDGHLVAADFSRRIPGKRSPSATAAICIDVYYDNETGNQPFSINTVSRLPYAKFYWLGHRFDGGFGTVGTAAWYRNRDDTIVWSSDAMNKWYPAHPACDGVHVNQANGLMASVVQHSWSLDDICVYDLVKFTVSDLIQEPNDITAKPNMWFQTDMKFYDYSQWYTRWVVPYMPVIIRKHLPAPTMEVCLDMTHVMTLRTNLGPKGRDHWTYANIHNETVALLKADPKYQLLLRTFPLKFINYQRDLANFVYGFFAASDATVMRAMRDAYGEHLTEYDLQRRAINSSDPSVINWKVLLLLASSCALMFYLHKRSLKPASATDWLLACFSKPFSVVSSWLQSKSDKLKANQAVAARAKIIDDQKEKVTEYLRNAKATIQTTATQTKTSLLAKAAERLQLLRHLHSSVSTPSGTIAPSEVWWTCFLSPIVEETLKRIPYLGPMFTALIAVGDCSQYNDPTYLEFFFHLVMHTLFNIMPMGLGHMAHIIYNVVAYKLLVRGHDNFLAPCSGLAGLANQLLFTANQPKDPEGLKYIQSFDAAYYHNDEPIYVPDDEIKLYDIGVENSHVQCVNMPAYADVVLDPRLVLTGDIDNMIASTAIRNPKGYYRAYYVNYPMFKPAKTGHNMANVVFYRLMKNVTPPQPGWWNLAYTALRNGGYVVGNDCPCCDLPACFYSETVEEVATRDVTELTTESVLLAPTGQSYFTKQMATHDPHWELTDETVNEWLTHTDRQKRKRYISALEAVKSSPITPESKKLKSCQVNIKLDEVLLKVSKDRVANGSIPRPIHAVDPTIAVTLGPQIYLATEYLKEILNTCGFGRINQYHIVIRFAAGATAEDLDLWFNLAVHCAREADSPTITIFVAGDDSLIVTPWGIWVGDLSACDRTVSLDALLLEARVLRDIGVDASIITLLLESCHSQLKCMIKGKDSQSVFIKRLWERNTGGVDTTVGNTIIVIGAWHLAVLSLLNNPPTKELSDKHDREVEYVFLQLGLNLKLRHHDGPWVYRAPPCEFLKGWWLWSDEKRTYAWTYLPSRFLKVSKTMKNPMETMKRNDKPDLEEALRRFLSGIACSLLRYPTPSVLYQTLARWRAARPGFVWWEEENPIWIKAPENPLSINNSDFYEACALRYGQDETYWSSFFVDHFSKLDVGILLRHPAWAMLAADYA